MRGLHLVGDNLQMCVGKVMLARNGPPTIVIGDEFASFHAPNCRDGRAGCNLSHSGATRPSLQLKLELFASE